jgi:signal transduction histidine kinase
MIEIVHSALVWIALSAMEGIAGFYLQTTPQTESYYHVALGLSFIVFMLIPLLGRQPVVADIQEICLYDVFLQVYGLLTFAHGVKPTLYLTLAQLIIVLKLLRLGWPAMSLFVSLPKHWPPFGIIGVMRKFSGNHEGGLINPVQKRLMYWSVLAILPAAFVIQKIWLTTEIPLPGFVIATIVLIGAKKLLASLNIREDEYNKAEHALGLAEGEAAAQAKSVAALTAKNAQIEQQALALAAQNTQLEALSAEREAMMQELAARNASLRDANHDFKVPLLGLTALVHRLQDQVTDAEPAQLLAKLDHGLEELRSMMGDIIQQAKVSTELTTPPARRLEVMELGYFFHDRFHEMARKRGVSFAVRADEFAVFANEMLLRRAITNLANNAILYAEPGTQVTLSLRHSGARCYVRVYDTGPGIANAAGPDRRANFANLIDTIKERRQPITPDIANAQGHGLGLQIVQRLCHELGSEIELQSILGFGTVFRFSIPLAG